MNLKHSILFFITTIILLSNITFAQFPTMPHKFYGNVYVNGQPAPDGTTILAKIEGKYDVATTTTLNGKYGYYPYYFKIYYDKPGKIINFYVNGIDTGTTAIFTSGTSTQLNLSITSTTTTATSPTGTTGGSSPGGSSGGTTTIPATTTVVTQTTVQGCQEKWTCTKWSECNNNIQTRTCTDENNCGTDLYKPFESQPCVTEETKGESSLITGFVSLLSTPTIIGSIIVIILVVIGLLYFFVIRKTV